MQQTTNIQTIDFDEIGRSLNTPLIKDQYWYIIDKKWYDSCRQYNKSGEEDENPGPIDNSALFESSTTPTTSNSNNPITSTVATQQRFKTPSKSDAVAICSRPLKNNLSENEDFLVIPQQAWDILVAHFSVRDPSHVIKRRVIENNPGNFVVEVYPLNLLLCLHAGNGTSAGIVEKQFSRKSQLKEVEEEMRKLFNINETSQTKLWVGNSTVYESEAASTNTNGNLQNSPPIALPNVSTPPLVSNSIISSTTLGNSNIAATNVPAVATMLTRNAQAKQAFDLPIKNSSEDKLISSSSSSSVAAQNINSNGPSSSSDSTTDESSTSTSSPHLRTLQDAGLMTGQIVTIEYRNIDGIWPSCKPKCGSVSTRSSRAQPGLCGLSNIGNTCFMNSALQCLSNTPPLTEYILSDRYIDDINLNNPLGMHGEIAKTYSELIKNLWSGSNTTYIPREFKMAVGRFAPQFSSYSQQDCQELMAFLLDGLHEDLNRIKEKPYIEIKNDLEQRSDEVVAAESWSNYRKRNDSIVVDTFHALLKSTLVCPECHLVSVTFDPFCYLSLPLPVKREKLIELVYVPAPKRLDSVKYYMTDGSDNNPSGLLGYAAPGANEFRLQPIQISKFSIPKSGPASEICQAVAKTINQHCKTFEGKLYGKDYAANPDDLIVAEIYNNKFSRVYESTDHYSTVGDEFIVYEKKDKYCIPVYLRERKNETSSSLSIFGNILMLHVPDLKYETIYKAMLLRFKNPKIIESTEPSGIKCDSTTTSSNATTRTLRSSPRFQSIQPTNEETQMIDGCSEPVDEMDIAGVKNESNEATQPMETDESIQADNSNCRTSTSTTSFNTSLVTNGISYGDNRELFKISIVNSSGSSTIGQIKPGDENKYTSKLYLAADFQSSTLLSPQFSHLKPKDSFASPCESPLHINLHREGPKPTLQLKDCISQFTNIERLGADDPWYCPKCKKHQQATKKFDIWSLPKILIIHLKRFSFSRSWRDKIDTMVEFPVEGLDLSEHVLCPDQKKGNLTYDLIGVANHYGGLGGGHYTAYAKNKNQKSWFYFDDSAVAPSSADSVVSKSAYVLFYQQRE